MAGKLVIPGLPKILQIDRPILTDDSIFQKKLIQIPPNEGNSAVNLNTGNSITFSFSGETKWYSLSDPNTGFWTKVGFRTQSPAGTDNANAVITPSNMFWAHAFSEASFRLGSTPLETVNNPGVVMETLAHLKGDEFRYRSGEVYSFIPDEGLGDATYKYVVGEHRAVGDAAGTTAANIAASSNAAATALRTVVNTALGEVINNGFKRRMERYNYPVNNNATNREAWVFTPLRLIFGCCNVERLLKVINFEVKLTRKPNAEYHEMFFGAAETGVKFDGEAGTGFQSMILQLVEYIPNPVVTSALNTYITGKDRHGKIHWPFLVRNCDKQPATDADEITVKTKKTTHPRYVYVVAKGATGNHNQKGAVTRNYSLCRHCDIKTVRVNADGIDYPDVSQEADFDKNNFAKFYEDFKTGCRNHGNEAAISATDYKNNYTIFVVDCSYHHVKGSNTTVDTLVTITRDVPDADNQRALNPRNAEYFVITESQKSFVIDCIEGTVTEEK